MSYRVVVLEKKADHVEARIGNLVGEKGDNKIVVVNGVTQEIPKSSCFGAYGLAERRITELLEDM